MQLLTLADLRQRENLLETRRGWLTLDEVIEWLEIGTIVRRFGTWAVTEYGVECLIEYYPIEMKRLSDPHWVDHLADKNWVTGEVLRDFIEARTFAIDETKRSSTIDLATRFAVLKRDGYRCQMCGRTAQDGVTLEVDHKVPRAKGGSRQRSNLWTLCFDCNRGKRDSDL